MWYCLPRSFFFNKEKRAFFPSGSFQLWQTAGVWDHAVVLWPGPESGPAALVCHTVCGVIWSSFGTWSNLSDSCHCLHGDTEWVTSWDHQECPAVQLAKEAPASGPLQQVTMSDPALLSPGETWSWYVPKSSSSCQTQLWFAPSLPFLPWLNTPSDPH